MRRFAAFAAGLLLFSGGALAQETGTDLNNRGVLEGRAGRLEEGIRLLRQARAQDPNDLQVRKNLSGMLTDWAAQLRQKGQLPQAVSALEEAAACDPDNGWTWVALADLHYLTDPDLSKAVSCWKRAFGKIPASRWAAVSERIAQAQRDITIERGFDELKTEHFRIRFENPENAQAVSGLGDQLEKDYLRLKGLLQSAPSHPLTVTIYGQQGFERVVERRDWALGLYDGRIRLRSEDLGSDEIRPVLSHELAHAFLAQTYGHAIPVWVHEGFAQMQEQPDGTARPLPPFPRESWVPLKWLDRRFLQPAGQEDVRRAYAQAHRVVSFLIQKAGMPAFAAYLGRLQSGDSPERAFDRAFAPLRLSDLDRGIP